MSGVEDEPIVPESFVAHQPTTPPTERPTKVVAEPTEFVVKTHRRHAIIATVLMFPVGVFALICSYVAMFRIADEKYESAKRWGDWANLIGWIAIASGACIIALTALMVALTM